MRAHVPVTKVRGFEARRVLIFMSLLTGMVAVGGRPQLGEVGQGSGRARLCACFEHSTLNSAIEQELRDRRVEGRANATSSA